MNVSFEELKKHLERTGRMKLLPRILSELKEREARAAKLTSKKETAKENPTLISGWRSIENGILTDRTGKRALVNIYQRATKA